MYRVAEGGDVGGAVGLDIDVVSAVYKGIEQFSRVWCYERFAAGECDVFYVGIQTVQYLVGGENLIFYFLESGVPCVSGVAVGALKIAAHKADKLSRLARSLTLAVDTPEYFVYFIGHCNNAKCEMRNNL